MIRPKHRNRLLWIVGLVWGCAFLFPLPSDREALYAQNDRRNLWDTKRNSAPHAPRPKADEEITRTLRDAMGRDFGPNSLRTNFYFVIFFFFLAVVVGSLVYYDIHYRQRFRSSFEDPGLLFHELCEAHELTRSEKRFLKNFADRLDLDDPLPLFVEPEHFSSALKNKHFDADRSTIAYFLEKLFDLEPKTPSESLSSSSPSGRLVSPDAPTVSVEIR